MSKTKITFDKIYFYNRWMHKEYSRPCDWTVLGLSVWWSGPESFCYKICFFGLELKIWFNRNFY